MSLAMEPVARRRGPMGRKEVLVDGAWVPDAPVRRPGPAKPAPAPKRQAAPRTYVPRTGTCNHCGSEFVAGAVGRIAALGPCCKPPVAPKGHRADPRYMEALEAACRLGGNKHAAAEMGISEQTIKNHISRALRELGASSAAQAAWMLWCKDAPPRPEGPLLSRLRALVEEFGE